MACERYSNETPQEREERVRWLKGGCENDLYRPEGEDIASSMLKRLCTFGQNLLLSGGELPLPEETEMPPVLSEQEAQEQDARIRACYGVSGWEWRLLGFVLGLIGLLVLRHVPACADWGWP